MDTNDRTPAEHPSQSEAIAVLCETGFDWAAEYGWCDPERAKRVWAAAVLLRPDLEPRL